MKEEFAPWNGHVKVVALTKTVNKPVQHKEILRKTQTFLVCANIRTVKTI